MNINDVLNETRDCSGKNNNNYKGPSKRGVRAEHLEAEKSKGKKCVLCGSTKNLEMAETKPGSKKFRTKCKSCHSKQDNRANNINKK